MKKGQLRPSFMRSPRFIQDHGRLDIDRGWERQERSMTSPRKPLFSALRRERRCKGKKAEG